MGSAIPARLPCSILKCGKYTGAHGERQLLRRPALLRELRRLRALPRVPAGLVLRSLRRARGALLTRRHVAAARGECVAADAACLAASGGADQGTPRAAAGRAEIPAGAARPASSSTASASPLTRNERTDADAVNLVCILGGEPRCVQSRSPPARDHPAMDCGALEAALFAPASAGGETRYGHDPLALRTPRRRGLIAP